MNIEAERRKRIARMLKEGMNEDQIKASLGPTKEAAARLPQPEAPREEIERKPEWKSTASGMPINVGGMDTGGNFILNIADRLMGTLGAPAAGIAQAAKSGNPLDAVTGTLSNIGSRMTEQQSLSEALDRPNDTWGQMAGNFGLDVLADPATYVGGTGLLRAIAKRAGRGAVAGGARSLGKQAAVGTAAAGATALGARMNPEEAGTMALPLGAVAGSVGAVKHPRAFYSALEREIGNLGTKPQPSIKIAQALRKRPIKAGEWRDTNMDALLTERSTWNPQELLAEVNKRRPRLSQTPNSDYVAYSTARGQDERTYEAVPLRQEGYNSGIPEGPSNHFGNDVISHYRTDVAYQKVGAAPITPEEKSARNWALTLSRTNSPDSPQRLNAEQKLADLIKARGGIDSKDFVYNEGQSDVHQAGRKYGVRGPKDDAFVKKVEELQAKRWTDRPSASVARRDIRDKVQDRWDRAMDRYANSRFEKPEDQKEMIETYGFDPQSFEPGGEFYPKKYSQPNPRLVKMYNEMIRGVQYRPGWGSEYKDFGVNAPYFADLGSKRDEILDSLNNRAAMTENKPNPGAAMADSWDLFGLKSALRDAVESGADRFGIVTGDTVDTILGEGANIGSNPGRAKFYDDTLIKKMEKFLRAEGAEQKFGEPESFRDEYAARFIDITEKIKALVAAGMPLWMAMLMVQNDETQ